MLWTNERADVRRGVSSGTEPQLFRFFNAKRDEFFRDPLLDEEPLHGQTNLAAIRVAAPNGRTGRHIEVGIRENDHGVFAAKFENRWNQFFRTGFGDTPARCHASGEDHFVRRGINQSLPDFSAALHDRDEILRKRCVDEKFLDQYSAESRATKTSAKRASTRGLPDSRTTASARSFRAAMMRSRRPRNFAHRSRMGSFAQVD